MGNKILVVDDEKLIVMEVTAAYDGEEALALAKSGEFDLILLDVMLPKLTGFEVCQQVREFSDVPIIMLTAKGDDIDKIMGLEYGADDYVTKPFNILEVKARIKAIIRRTKKDRPEEQKNLIVKGEMKLDCESRRVFIGEREVNLTAKEFDMLELLALNQNKVYSREKLLSGAMIIRGMQELSMYISAACGRKLRAIQVIQSMCIQSGELVIILGDKIYFRGKFFKSLRFRIMLLLIVIGIIPCIVVGQGIISNYEKRAVSVRTAEIQNQSTMLGSRLGKAGYLKGVPSETLDAELAQLADIYSGRILLIDDEFQVVKDTYDMEEGKTIISEAVMECYGGNNTSEYDSKNHYIEVTQAIQDPNSGQTEGIMLVSVSTDSVVDSVDVLHSKAVAVEIAVGVVIITISFFVSALLVRPFGRITQAIGAVTEGYDTDNLHENAYTETMLISDAANRKETTI